MFTFSCRERALSNAPVAVTSANSSFEAFFGKIGVGALLRAAEEFAGFDVIAQCMKLALVVVAILGRGLTYAASFSVYFC